jgi:hypothetical protein
MEQLESESNNCAPFQKAANLPVERPDNTDFCLKKPRKLYAIIYEGNTRFSSPACV